MKKIVAILQTIHANVDWENENALVDGGLLDSFDIITLIGELNQTFGVEIGLEQMEPENFNSVDAMEVLLKTLGAKP